MTAAEVEQARPADSLVDDGLTVIQRRRLQDRKEWEAFWKMRDLMSRDGWLPRAQYHVQRFLDMPATWFREKIAEPLHDKYRMPYYHRRFDRVPEIDQCGVVDVSCYAEANEQYRNDKIVDYYILQVLTERVKRCFHFNPNNIHKCHQVMEDFELAELNSFIKHGELGPETTVRDVYMKQKHRMIWERRHPEVMAERERKWQEYLAKKAAGEFDMSFWKQGLHYQDKKKSPPIDYGTFVPKPVMEADQPLSRDWEYYKKVAEDPEFDKAQGKTGTVPFFP